MCESKERDWSRVTPRSLIWVVSGTVVPEILTEPSFACKGLQSLAGSE